MEGRNLALVILAAGSSSRMGTSKQLLPVGEGQTLLEKTVSCALDSSGAEVVVVLGCDAETHHLLLKDKPVRVLINSDWALGMGNTLKFALKNILERNPLIQAALFMVCDQPLISSGHLKAMIDLYVHENPVAVASTYNNQVGVPAFFDKVIFPELLSIEDHSGAREVLRRLKSNLKLIPFEAGAVDLDTPEDYKIFLQNYK